MWIKQESTGHMYNLDLCTYYKANEVSDNIPSITFHFSLNFSVEIEFANQKDVEITMHDIENSIVDDLVCIFVINDKNYMKGVTIHESN